MDRSPLFLAALASAAVPGLDPASVEALPSEQGQLFDVAFVQDTQHRRWVVRAPRTQAAGAQMDVTVALLGLLARRLPFSVPTPKGFAPLKEGGRAAVYPYLPGRTIDFARLPAGPGLAAELGRAIAALHNADHAIFEEAGLPAYDADTYRTRRLSELDRAAASGHVPTSLLSRWERQLEDVTLWRFAPTPTHGDLSGDQVLVVFDDEEDAASAHVRGVTGWEDAKVADPADDLAALVGEAPRASFETVLEAYAHARVERPDAHLETRARLAAEMHGLVELMTAVSSGDRVLVERRAAELRRLDERIHAEEEAQDDYRRASARPVPRGPVVAPPPQVVEDDEDEDEDADIALMFAPTVEHGGEQETDLETSQPAIDAPAPDDSGQDDVAPENSGPGDDPRPDDDRVDGSSAEDVDSGRDDDLREDTVEVVIQPAEAVPPAQRAPDEGASAPREQRT